MDISGKRSIVRATNKLHFILPKGSVAFPYGQVLHHLGAPKIIPFLDGEGENQTVRFTHSMKHTLNLADCTLKLLF